MLIRRQDISVLLFYYLGYSKIRNYSFYVSRKPVTRFVAFHDIEPNFVSNFESNINFLQRHTNVISFDDYMSGRLSTEKINVVITFDDGFKSWITCAVPVLRKLELSATFFISAGFVGLSKNDESAFIRSNLMFEEAPRRMTTGGLTRDDVRRISDQGFTIGGHTFSHCIISSFRDKTLLTYEIEEDKLALEKLSGTKIKYFSYPTGVYHNPEIDIVEILQKVGYRGAVTTTSGYNDACTNPYLLNRELTSASMSGQVFRARVYGNYDAVDSLKRLGMRLISSD